MDIDKLKTLIVLADKESFTETAETLYTTQSNISKHIRSIEKELGIVIINRNSKNFTLTDDGKIVLEKAKIIVKEYNQLNENLAKRKASLNVACMSLMAQYDITKLITEFRKTYPEIDLYVEELDENYSLEKIKYGKIDIAVCRDNEKIRKNYKVLTIYTDRLAVVLSRNHYLAKEDKISLKQLKNEKFLQVGDFFSKFEMVGKAAAEARVEVVAEYSSGRTENILSMIKAEDGISLMMEKTIKYYDDNDLAIIPLKEEVLGDIILATNKDIEMTTNAKIFWEFAKKWSKREYSL